MRLLPIMIMVIAAGSAFAQGKLDQVREAVDSSRSKDDARTDTCDSSDGSSSTDCATPDYSSMNPRCIENDPSFAIFAATVGAPWVAPYKFIDPGLSVSGLFTPYPFAVKETPHILLDRPDESNPAQPLFHSRGNTQWYSVRTSIETGSDFNGLDRVGLRLFLDTDTRRIRYGR